MRVLVAGAGSAGKRHIGNLLELGPEVVVYDSSDARRADVLGQFPGVRVLEQPIWDIDAMVIATPWDKHLPWVECAVAEKIPFLVEKPLGSLEQLPRWRQLAALDLPVNQVGYQCRFHKKAQAMKLLFPGPAWGDFSCCCRLGGKYGPFLLEAVSHDIDLALWFGANREYNDVSIGDGFIQLSEDWRVQYEEGDDYHRMWGVGYHGDLGATAHFHSPEELGADMYRAELEHFLACVREKTLTICPLADGLRVLEIVAQVEALRQTA